VPPPPARRSLTRYAAPAAFLLGVTIAVLLIHSALGGKGGSGHPATTLGPVTHATTARVPPKTRTITQATTSTTGAGSSVAGAEYTTVQTGDTFGSIAGRNGTTVAELEALNPGVSSNALQVGQRIRVK
jgi:LysM repeat protein